MPLTGYPFPYNIDNLLSGAVRILRAPTTVAVPASINDVIAMVAPYGAKAGWVDVGATRDAFSYSRGFDTEGLEIQQVAGNILEEITDISRSINVPFAEFSAEHMQLIEGAPAIGAVAAAANAGAQQRIGFGGFSSLTRERYAFVSMRPKAAGQVTEPGGATRGRFVMGVAYQAQLAADEIEMEQGKGELTAVEVAYTLFPQAGQPTGQDYGAWYLENAGTIAAV